MERKISRLFAMAALAAALPLTPAFAAMDSAAAILTLINSPSSVSPRLYREAAEIVYRDAQSGKVLQQYIIAVKAMDDSFALSSKISAEKREQFLARSRPKIKDMAERLNKPLAWYLLSIEDNDMAKLKKALNGGNVQALNAWGTLSLERAMTNPLLSEADRDNILKKSYECFKRAAVAHDANGMYNLGICHLQGYGVPVDVDRAIDCFKDAAEKGHPEAMNNIGGLYRDGLGLEQDYTAAARWFARSADLGNDYGLLNYALCLQRGEGVIQDEERAAKMLRESAAAGNIEAMNAYALCLLGASGVPKNAAESLKYLEAAAKGGFPPAMENLAALLESGDENVEKDPAAANIWRMRARAIRGDKNAAAWLMENKIPLRLK